MSDVTIRPARRDDAEALIPMFARWAGEDEPDEKVERYRERLASLVENPMHQILVAEVDGAVAGYAAAQDYGPALRRDWSTARMHDLWVSPGARGHGAGTALFEGIRDWAQRETSIRFLEWQASEIAVDFYRQLGLDADDSGTSDAPHYEIEVHLPGEEDA